MSWGRRGLQREGVAHRVADRPWFFLQRKASTTSVSCATRCSTPRPSSSVTSSSTASRAWVAPSNAPCASQVGVPSGQQVGRGEGPRSPALQALAQCGCRVHGRTPQGTRSPWPHVPPLCPADLALLSLLSASVRRQRDLLALLPACCCQAFPPTPASLALLQWGLQRALSCELCPAPVGLSLHLPPAHPTPPAPWPVPAPAASVLQAGGVKGWFCQPNSPAPRLAAGPGERLPQPEASLRGSAEPPSCCPDGSRCAWGRLAFPCLPPDICRLPWREAHPGEGAWWEGISEGLTSQTHSCFRATSCVRPRPGPPRALLLWEVGAVTCGKGLCYWEDPTHSHPQGSQEPWHTLVPLPPQSLSLGSPHPSVTNTLHELSRG